MAIHRRRGGIRGGTSSASAGPAGDSGHQPRLSSLSSGNGSAPKTADVERQLEQAFAQLEQVADTAALSPRCRERLQKARRVVTDLLATVTFFIMTVTAKIEALDLAPEVESVVLNQLIPALYLQRVAAPTTDRVQRQRLQHHATELLAPLKAPGSPLTGLPPDELALIEQVATEAPTVSALQFLCRRPQWAISAAPSSAASDPSPEAGRVDDHSQLFHPPSRW